MIVSSATGIKVGEKVTVKVGWEQFCKDNGITPIVVDKEIVTVTGYRTSAAYQSVGVRVRGFTHPAHGQDFVPLDYLLRS